MSPVPIIGHNHRLSALGIYVQIPACLPGLPTSYFTFSLASRAGSFPQRWQNLHISRKSAQDAPLLFEPEETTRTAFTSLMGIYHLNCYRSHCLRGNLEPPRGRCWRTLSRPMAGSLSDEPTASSSCWIPNCIPSCGDTFCMAEHGLLDLFTKSGLLGVTHVLQFFLLCWAAVHLFRSILIILGTELSNSYHASSCSWFGVRRLHGLLSRWEPCFKSINSHGCQEAGEAPGTCEVHGHGASLGQANSFPDWKDSEDWRCSWSATSHYFCQLHRNNMKKTWYDHGLSVKKSETETIKTKYDQTTT
jgi:hypothetical protein